ncbi:MAG: tetratricopeptide repeat protein, partial [Rickettsiales bacterium]|nr:tetratricopeptide repeat protein [Rickettsiales bacterium]
DLCEWQKRSLDTVPLTFEQIESYFVDKSFYEPTSANKAKVYLRLSQLQESLRCRKEHEAELNKNGLSCSKEMLDTLREIIMLYLSVHNPEEAYSSLEIAIKISSELPIDKSEFYVGLQNSFGTINYLLGYYNKALIHHTIALKLQKTLDINHPKIATLYNNIGLCHIQLKQYTYCFEFFNKALQIFTNCKDIPGQVTTWENIGVYYSKTRQYEKALAIYQKTLKIYEQLYSEHKCASILLNLGDIYDKLSLFKKALDYKHQALTLFKKADQITYIIICKTSIGVTYSKLQKPEMALKYLTKALEINMAIFGEEHQVTYLIYDKIGRLYKKLGNYEKGLEYQEKALQISKAIFGENHPDTATSYNNVGSTYVELGKHSKALKYLTKALEINKTIFGENHPDTATSYDNVGSTYMKYNPEEALKYFLKGCSINTKFGIPISSGISVFLGESEQSAHRECIQYFLMSRKHKINYIKAIKSAEKALSIKKAIYGEESATVIQFLSYLHNQYIKLPENLKSQTWVKEWVDLMHFGLQRPITNFTEIPEHIDSESIRVVSYNICADFFDNKDKTVDSHHHWSIRSTYVIKLLSQVTPDIMCLQELSAEQASNLTIAFRDKFESIFLSQTPSEVEPTGAICYGEDVASWTDKKLGTPLIGIFVNRNTNWKIVSEKTGRFWLNELPDEIPVSYDRGETDKGFGNMNTYRAILWCMVINIDTEKTIYIFNSHYPLNGNSETRFKCAELERAKIKEITGDAKWISAGDRNLIKCDDDNLHYNPLTIYKTLTKDVHDLRDHRPDKHYGISGTWLGFTYDQHKSRIGTSSADVLDVMVSNLKPVQSFFHPGIFNFADGTIIPLSNYADSSLLDSYNESRYFASDHVLLGADLCFE